MTKGERLIRQVMPEIGTLMESALAGVGENPQSGSGLAQAGMVDGIDIVEAYLREGECGCAFEHLIYMVDEAPLSVSLSTFLCLEQLAESMRMDTVAIERIRVQAMRNQSNIFITPEAVAQKQLDAYNAHDLDALVDVYSSDARIFEHPNTLLASGAEQLRERFAQRFQEPNLHADLLSRIVTGRFVVDHERVARTFPEGKGTIELIATYEVVDGKIINAWFLSGPKKCMPNETIGVLKKVVSRNRITIALLALSIFATAVLIVGSFVSYAQPVNAAEMQNRYITRILAFGVPILVMQFAALTLILTGRREGSAAT